MSTELMSITPISYPAASARAVVAAPITPAIKAAPEPETPDEEGLPLALALEELNRYIAGSRTDLRFTVDRDAGQVVVSIIDAESGQVLRQMPSVEALRIARYLEHDRLGLIRQRA